MNIILTVFVVCGFVLLLCCLIILGGNFLGQSGEVEIEVNDSKKIISKKGIKLLSALAESDIHLPAACGGKGNCGRCKVKILSGGGPVTAIEKVMLTSDALKDNQRLACQLKLRENIKIDIDKALLQAKSFKARLIESKTVAYKIKTLKFKLEDGQKFDFKAGQYVQVSLDLPWEKVIRAYSISSSPYITNEFSLDIQLIDGGLMSSRMHKCEIGSVLDFTGPYGDMVLDDNTLDSRTILMVAGGVGLAPMRSMVAYLNESGFKGKFYLFHGARSRKNLYCEDEFNKLVKLNKNFKYIPVLSEPLLEDGWTGAEGLVTEALQAEIMKSDFYKKASDNKESENLEAFLCGPSAMMEAATTVLVMNGIAPEFIHSDPFNF